VKDKKNKYQIVTVLNAKAEDKEKTTAKLEKWIKELKAEVTKIDHMGQKELVYEINKQRKGDFYVFDIESDKPVEIKEFNLLLNREPNIVRYLILKI
jgi:ribosomal protein S6